VERLISEINEIMHLGHFGVELGWSGTTRDWSPIGAVTLTPERDSVVEAHSKAELRQPLAA